MNKKTLILLLILVVLIAGASVLYNTLADRVDMDNLATGETVPAEVPEGTEAPVNANLAPDFTVYDLEGNSVSLSDFRGKPTFMQKAIQVGLPHSLQFFLGEILKMSRPFRAMVCILLPIRRVQ